MGLCNQKPYQCPKPARHNPQPLPPVKFKPPSIRSVIYTYLDAGCLLKRIAKLSRHERQNLLTNQRNYERQEGLERRLTIRIQPGAKHLRPESLMYISKFTDAYKIVIKSGFNQADYEKLASFFRVIVSQKKYSIQFKITIDVDSSPILRLFDSCLLPSQTDLIDFDVIDIINGIPTWSAILRYAVKNSKALIISQADFKHWKDFSTESSILEHLELKNILDFNNGIYLQKILNDCNIVYLSMNFCHITFPKLGTNLNPKNTLREFNISHSTLAQDLVVGNMKLSQLMPTHKSSLRKIVFNYQTVLLCRQLLKEIQNFENLEYCVFESSELVAQRQLENCICLQEDIIEQMDIILGKQMKHLRLSLNKLRLFGSYYKAQKYNVGIFSVQEGLQRLAEEHKIKIRDKGRDGIQIEKSDGKRIEVSVELWGSSNLLIF
ncbi:hypothetical protein FGO68_gene2853 [Halteria grandinella]|uniref:Uncharacterized protein n=1 Tax=Halteria grandinella TaxID=5974 RepID=A0A8J8TA79_HALGN|nr:hypothetical protein FGO68_gene2853 [Halteria grandinella]